MNDIAGKARDLLVVAVAFIVISFVGLFVIFYIGARRLQPMTSAISHLESNARKVISGDELQRWATNLLANPVRNGLATDDQFRTNFPVQLLTLYRWRAPEIIIEEGPPKFVRIWWGGHDTGDCCFDIGPTNFESPLGDSKWRDGVYFYSSHPQKSE